MYKKTTQLIVLTLLINLVAGVAVQAAEYSQAAFRRHKHSAYANAGFAEGGLTIGGDYENSYSRTFGIGAYGRFFTEDEDKPAGFGGLAIGGFIRPHFHRRAWDLYISPGFGVFLADSDAVDETALGPMLNIGVMYQVSEDVAVGVENTRYYGWFADDLRGLIRDDLTFKVRFGL